jgi:GNAT superfamily N-acetyltransferase
MALPALLRPAGDADADDIAALLIDTRSAFMPYAPSVHPEHELRDWVRTRLIPAGGVWVAEVDGQVVATMATEAAGDGSWITQMAVTPALIGRGLGSLLLAHALNTLALPIRLYCFQQNTGARRFYERHGYVAVEFSDGQGNEEGCPDVVYELRVLAREL